MQQRYSMARFLTSGSPNRWMLEIVVNCEQTWRCYIHTVCLPVLLHYKQVAHQRDQDIKTWPQRGTNDIPRQTASLRPTIPTGGDTSITGLKHEWLWGCKLHYGVSWQRSDTDRHNLLRRMYVSPCTKYVSVHLLFLIQEKSVAFIETDVYFVFAQKSYSYTFLGLIPINSKKVGEIHVEHAQRKRRECWPKKRRNFSPVSYFPRGKMWKNGQN